MKYSYYEMMSLLIRLDELESIPNEATKESINRTFLNEMYKNFRLYNSLIPGCIVKNLKINNIDEGMMNLIKYKTGLTIDKKSTLIYKKTVKKIEKEAMGLIKKL